MTFYHGTTEKYWTEIQKEGILYGRRYVTNNNGSIVKEVERCTYLATTIDEAKCYGSVILEVEYDPYKHPTKNNYVPDCWQVRVYEPISITNIKKV